MKIILIACKGQVDYSYGLANAIIDEWKAGGNPGFTYLMPMAMHATEKGRAFAQLLDFLKAEPINSSDVLVCVPHCDETTANQAGLNVADHVIDSDDIALVLIEGAGDEEAQVSLHGYDDDGYASAIEPSHWVERLADIACATFGFNCRGPQPYTCGWFICD